MPARFTKSLASPLIRLSIVGVLAAVLLTVLVSRLWYIQVLSEEDYQKQAITNTIRRIVEPAPRGRIFDSNGELIVGNKTANVVTIRSSVVQNDLDQQAQLDLAARLAVELSKTGISMEVNDLVKLMNNPRYELFDQIPIVSGVSNDLRILLAEHQDDFPGIQVVERSIRYYPHGTLAAHLVGYVGAITEDELEARQNSEKEYVFTDEIGKTGIELSFENELRGTPGYREAILDANSNIIGERNRVPAVPGNDLRLTIDLKIQEKAETELERGILEARQRKVPVSEDEENAKSKDLDESEKFYPATGGSVVVLDPNGSRVLALASYPTFNPREFIGGISDERFAELNAQDSSDPLNNRAIQGIYSIGSAMKPITAYSALESGLIGEGGFLKVQETIEDLGYYTISDCTTKCEFQNLNREPNGAIDLSLAIAVSSDVYFYQLAEKFEILPEYNSQEIQESARSLGFGGTTGVALPFEKAGHVPDAENRQTQHDENPEVFPNPVWSVGDTLNVSIGQGDLGVTPLQLANAYAALANGGSVYSPNVAEAILDPLTGEVRTAFASRRVRNLDILDNVRGPLVEGMLGATRLKNEDHTGTAYYAFLNFPHDIWPVAGKTGTVESINKEDTSVFVAFGPEPEPSYLMVAILEEAGFGSTAAAPVVRNTLEAIARAEP